MSADTHTHIHQLMSYELVYTSIHSSKILVMAPFTKQTLLTITAQKTPSSTFCWTVSASYSGQLRVTQMLNCDWSVDATGSCLVFHSLTLCDVDQMTAQTRSTVVGPIRFSNRSNNCRVVASTKDGCRPRAHTARLYVFRCLYARQKTKIA